MSLPEVLDDFKLEICRENEASTNAVFGSDLKDELSIEDPLEVYIVSVTYMGEMDALLSDAKKLFERAGRGKCSIMYAALLTKYSIDMAGQLTERMTGALGLPSFDMMHHLHAEIYQNFDRIQLLDHILQVKYAQFTCEGAIVEAVVIAVDDFLEQRAPVPSLSKKMIKLKDVIAWQTSRQPSPPPEAIRNIPHAMEHFGRWAEQNAIQVTDKRDQAIVMLLKDIDYY